MKINLNESLEELDSIDDLKDEISKNELRNDVDNEMWKAVQKVYLGMWDRYLPGYGDLGGDGDEPFADDVDNAYEDLINAMVEDIAYEVKKRGNVEIR